MSEPKDIPLHHQRLQLADKEKASKQRDAQFKQVEEEFAIAFGTPEGQRALKHIASLCGYNKSVVGGNPALGMDITQGTFYNATRLGVYLEIRSLLPTRILKQIEHELDEWVLS